MARAATNDPIVSRTSLTPAQPLPTRARCGKVFPLKSALLLAVGEHLVEWAGVEHVYPGGPASACGRDGEPHVA